MNKPLLVDEPVTIISFDRKRSRQRNFEGATLRTKEENKGLFFKNTKDEHKIKFLERKTEK